MIKYLTYFIGVILIISCSTSNEVASNKLFQKRKYKKGWHINTSKKFEKKRKGVADKVEIPNNIASNTDTTHKKKERLVSELDNNVITTNERSTKVSKANVSSVNEITLLKKNKNLIQNFIQPIQLDSRFNIPGKINTHVAPPDESDKRVLLAILAIIVLIFTTISPLAVLIGIGRGNSLRINSIIYFIAFMLALVGILSFFSASASMAPAAIALSASVILWLISVIHALFVIIRGY